jgi:hypothetical protein
LKVLPISGSSVILALKRQMFTVNVLSHEIYPYLIANFGRGEVET